MEYLDLPSVLYHGLYLLILFCALPLMVSLVVGVVLSVIQAATQIQEQTLTFVPKLIAVTLTLFLAAPWLGSELSEYCSSILRSLPLLEDSW
jgi:flagellar biosynthetic protein FliQ